MYITTIMIISGIINLIINRRNYIMILISLELIIIGIIILFLIISMDPLIGLDDIKGIAITIKLLAIGAAESTLGLIILIALLKKL